MVTPAERRPDISERKSLIKIGARGEDKETPRGQETAEDWWAASPASCRRQPAGKLFLKINTLVAASLTDIRDRISSECVPHEDTIGNGRECDLRSIPGKGNVHNASDSCRDSRMFVFLERGAAGGGGGSRAAVCGGM